MNVQYTKRAIKTIQGMDTKTKTRIRAAVNGIPAGDIKTLQGSPGGYRLRVGDWRVIFTYADANTVIVHKIAPRGQVYKGV